MNRPLTIREIQAKRKKEREAEQNKTRITNKTRLQNITIQLYGKKDKRAISQISIQIPPGKSVDLPTARLNSGQIDNLRKKGMITTNKIGVSGGVQENGYKAFLGKKKSSKNIKKTEEKPKSAKTTKKASGSKTKKDTDNKSDE
jgi:hypothetical protein